MSLKRHSRHFAPYHVRLSPGLADAADAAPDQRTSTQQLSDAIDHVIGISDRERDLRDRRDAAKYNDGPPITEEEDAEYCQFVDAREAKHREAHDRERNGGGSGELH